MKSVVLATVGLLAAGISAMAADILVKAPPKPVPIYNWTGCYVGANVGAAWTNKEFSDTTTVPGTFGDFGSANAAGYISGGQVGCDYQFAGTNIVIGARGMYDWAEIDFRHSLAPAAPNSTSRVRVQNFATAVGRLGVTAFDSRLMLYALGGGTWARDRMEVLFIPTNQVSEFARWNSSGWVAGGGFEFFLVQGLSFFAEYNHLGFDNKSVCFTLTPGFGLAGGCPGGGGNTLNVKQSIDAVMFGFNYRFNNLTSLVAK
jgi:outer membrane immunogenic protein